MIPLYDYIEQKIFPEIKDKAKNQEIMNDLIIGPINKIIKGDIKKILNHNKLITKQSLLRALRKFIIKNLMTEEQEISSNESLLHSLLRDGGLWLSKNNKEDINKRNEEMNEINNKLEMTSLIMVKHSVLFYEVLNNENLIKKYGKIKQEENEEFIKDV